MAAARPAKRAVRHAYRLQLFSSDKKVTVQLGTLLLVVSYIVQLSMAVALIFWFRGCDPQLSGAIASPDQAAVLYVDILSPHFKAIQSNVRWTTRGLAFALGALMTSYSCACFYMGSLTRLVMMAYGAATGPFVGLFILATVFPFVHSKGAGISTLLVLAAELVAMWRSISSGVKPPHMPVSLDYCPENGTAAHFTANATVAVSFPSHASAHDLGVQGNVHQLRYYFGQMEGGPLDAHSFPINYGQAESLAEQTLEITGCGSGFEYPPASDIHSFDAIPDRMESKSHCAAPCEGTAASL
ncbi:hypothetical protein HPB50_025546 [Hyalomma asiaticum]|uniref:Uncharacterized protein n=1 Tax=Hyalomma asiaticum TaxID=266040 RepID=A0ACB7RWC0_HYAAI|nr:hypothetical protein HPB50_025546 [Hyalomma asiaticum]